MVAVQVPDLHLTCPGEDPLQIYALCGRCVPQMWTSAWPRQQQQPSALQVANLLGEEIPQIYATCGRTSRASLRVLRPGLAVAEMAVSPLPGAPAGVWTVHFTAQVLEQQPLGPSQMLTPKSGVSDLNVQGLNSRDGCVPATRSSCWCLDGESPKLRARIAA